jgi:hypothetical protein
LIRGSACQGHGVVAGEAKRCNTCYGSGIVTTQEGK